ncbi:MAG TPA: translocation/assembly module TamB domain-containing protein, partial [Deltaproteobacteria bacterium]|nr:translocation/assembly module TamB domain-containing protein [Deltaproteobacteria bacterium]
TLPYLRNMKLDIRVNRRNPVYVDNNLAQLDINPDIHLTGELNNPVINGRVSVESGTVEFRNRTFTVTKGVIDYLDPYTTRATIDIESEVKVRDWMIYLKVSGTPDALNISLRSEPPEEDNDILSLLVIGRTSEELIAGEGGSTLSTSSMIAALVASRYGEDIREATGLDLFEVESGGDDDSGDTLRLTIGKELSRRIMLKYAMESKNSELSQRTVAEYKLFENIVINGFQDTRGIFGADLQYRLEFR